MNHNQANEAKWRALVKPLVLEMHRSGVMLITIAKYGGKVDLQVTYLLDKDGTVPTDIEPVNFLKDNPSVSFLEDDAK